MRSILDEDPAKALTHLVDRAKKANGVHLADVLSPLHGLPELTKAAVIGQMAIEELAAKPIDYVWADIVVAGTIALIAGGPGCGKTTLLFLLVVARLHDQPTKVLHREVAPAPAGKYVVLIEAEHGESSAARKLVRSCDALGIDRKCLNRLILVARKNVCIGDPAWNEVCVLASRGLVSDIVVDTIARATRSEANDEQEQIKVFAEVARAIELAQGVGLVVWLVAHTRKSENLELDDVSGSTQRVGQADTVLLMKAERRDGQVIASKVKFAKLREEPDDYPAVVDFVMKDGKVAEVVEKKTDPRPLEEQIWECLALGPQTKNRLREKLKRAGDDIEAALSALFDQKAIIRTSVSVRGKDYAAFCRKPGVDYDAARYAENLAGPRSDFSGNLAGPLAGPRLAGPLAGPSRPGPAWYEKDSD